MFGETQKSQENIKNEFFSKKEREIKSEKINILWEKFSQKIKRDRFGHYNFAKFEYGEDGKWRMDGKIIGENEVSTKLKLECLEFLNNKK